MSDSEVKDHIPYEIVGAPRETQTFGPSNQLEDILEITFRGPKGGIYTVSVPVTQADPASIDQAIQAKLDTIEAIHELGPKPHPDNAA